MRDETKPDWSYAMAIVGGTLLLIATTIVSSPFSLLAGQPNTTEVSTERLAQ